MTGINDTTHSGDPKYSDIMRVSPNDPSSNAMYNLRQYLSCFEFNPDSFNHYWSFEEVIDLANNQTTITRVYEEDKIYKITTGSSSSSYGSRTFISSNSSINYFEVGYRTGSGSINYQRQGESTTSASSYTCTLAASRTYFIKVTKKDVAQVNDTFNIGTTVSPNLNIGAKQEICFRLRPTTRETYEFSSTQSIIIYTSTGAIPFSKIRYDSTTSRFIYTVNLNSNTDYSSRETYFIKCKGIYEGGNYKTDLKISRVAYVYDLLA